MVSAGVHFKLLVILYHPRLVFKRRMRRREKEKGKVEEEEEEQIDGVRMMTIKMLCA